MAVNVTFDVARINILDVDDNLIDTIAFQAVDTIALATDQGITVTAGTLGDTPTITSDPQLSMVFWIRDRRVGQIELGTVANQPTWTNNQAGFESAVADIYAAFAT